MVDRLAERIKCEEDYVAFVADKNQGDEFKTFRARGGAHIGIKKKDL